MSLLRKFFNDKDAGPGRPTTQFRDSETDQAEGSRHAPRRELVHVVLRDTMRSHGIPSDWIECRVLSVVSRSAASGMHVTFIVRGGQERLLSYVPAFQASFWEVIRRFEPRAKDWLFSLSWQFDGMVANRAMPDPGSWTAARGAEPGPAADTPAPADDLEQDLKALFAIRDAALRTPEVPNFEATQPLRREP